MTESTTRVDHGALDELRRVIEREVADGLEGAELAIAHDGQLVFSEGFGAASKDTPIVLMSPTKTVLDSALWLLIADGRVDLEATIASYLPEFGTHGKEVVTVRQVMTHLGGFPSADLDWPEWQTRDARLAAYSRFELEYPPGSAYQYHPAPGAWVLADVIHAVTGIEHCDFLREQVLEPLGLEGINRVSLGEPESTQDAVLTHRFNLAPESLAKVPKFFYEGDELQIPGGLGLGTGRAVGFPGAGAVVSAQGVAMLYQAFLSNPAGLWDDGVLALATREVAFDKMARWGKPIRRSLSMYIAGDSDRRPGSEAAFFGTLVSAEAFGHDGLGGNFAWADPRSGLSAAFVTNTITFMPFEQHDRAARLSNAASRVVR